MLDVEFLTETKQIKPTLLYEYDSSVFKPLVDKKVLAWAKAKGLEAVPLNQNDPVMHLNEPSLFGERFFIIDLSLYLKGAHKEAMLGILHSLGEKLLTFKGYFMCPKEATEVFGEVPAFAAVRKLSTHIEVANPTKSSIKKILSLYTQEEDAALAAVSNFDLLDKALQQVASQDDMNIEVFYKKLDLIRCLCLTPEGQFDSVAFNRYILGAQSTQNFYSFHEIIFTLCTCTPDTSDFAILQMVREVDIHQITHGQEPRQVMAKIMGAIRDLLLVNATVGGAGDNSENISKFKKQKLGIYAQIDPLVLSRFQSYLMIEEPRLRNSENLAVDLQAHFFPRFFQPRS